MIANLAPLKSVTSKIDDDEAKSQVTTAMTESSFLVEEIIRGYHTYKYIFLAWYIFFFKVADQSMKIVKIWTQREFPAIRYLHMHLIAQTHPTLVKLMYVWQSCVEIEDYSVAYFDRITVFEVPYRWTSIKGGAHMHEHLIGLQITYSDEPRP